MYTLNHMEMLKIIVKVLVNVVQYGLIAVFAYQLVISMFGWFKRKEESADNYAPVNRFAVLVAAHNEENVIGNIVRNLKSLDYQKDMYDIFVIADNCSDNTARIARENGAEAFERFDNIKKGKGFALEWMFEKIFKMDKHYDAVCIFDADNLVSTNFLKEMNKHLCKGHKVIQGYLDSKNPMDSFASGSYSLTYWITNRLFQLPRYYLGLCCAIGGTGFVVSTDVLKEIGWGATCLVEDLEFTLKLVLKGMKVYWAHDAVVYDEKPLTLAQSWRQRKRWMQGHSDCACRYFKPLFTKAVKERNLTAFDCAIYVIQPLIVVISGAGMLAGIMKFFMFTHLSEILTKENICYVLLTLVMTYITIIFVFAEGKFNKKIGVYFLILPLYNITWIPIIIQGFLDKNNKEWAHTIHTRALDITDMEKLGKVS